MNIGPFDISFIETGYLSLDGGAMFGVVPKILWNSTNPADKLNRIILSMRLLLIKYMDHIIITDCGVGDKLNEKMSNIYNVDHSRYNLFTGLKNAGLAVDEVTDVLLTHLHFDHTGGATRRNNHGELVLTFPKAKYHVQKKHWQWAIAPSDRDRASFMTENFLPIEEYGNLNLIDGPGELFPGFELITFNGHTPAMQAPKISDGKNTLFYCADVFPTSSHIPPPYIMGYDVEPLKTLSEKKSILPKMAEEGWILFFEHDPYNVAGKVSQTEKGFKATQLLKDL